ncbi:MAG: ArgR family transcriptional regulator [Deltaproteobacteria bacterium]|nr:ArgR family transcriptional regulator [Deltaproteobacteria bacterium]
MTDRVHRRRRLIAEIIAQREIATQNGLVRAMRERGLDATQSSVSRDIARMGIVKAGGRYVLPSLPDAHEEWPGPVLDAQLADALVVIKVPPGQASPLALRLDREAWGEVVGTVAGDDTVFVACADRTARNVVLARLAGRLHPWGENEK